MMIIMMMIYIENLKSPSLRLPQDDQGYVIVSFHHVSPQQKVAMTTSPRT